MAGAAHMGLLMLAMAGAAQAETPPAIPAEAAVRIEFLATLSSKTSHPGDVFPIRLAEPLARRGAVLIPAGTLGLGEVVEAKPAAGGGAPGVLILAVRYLELGGRQIRLHGLNQDAVGRDRMASAMRGVSRSSAMVLPTLALGMAVEGGNVIVPRGGQAVAHIAAESEPVAVAAPRASASDGAVSAVEPLPKEVALSVPAPPPGYGQVVFYRPGTLNWRAIGCTIRQGEHKVSSLGSGRWFALIARPGAQEFTAASETADRLRLEIEPGKTQFVSCRMRASMLIARPRLTPEPSRDFHLALRDLRLVKDDDMGPDGPEGQVLREQQIRVALVERGDVRRSISIADRPMAEESGLEDMDPDTRKVLTRAAAKVIRKETKTR